MRPKLPGDARARITNQCRRGQSMVYDLVCEEVRLTIEITPVESPDGRGGWSVRAHARNARHQPGAEATGLTRTEALIAVARAWGVKGAVRGLVHLEWNAVARALRGVRAI
jgi:hypothetical protein